MRTLIGLAGIVAFLGVPLANATVEVRIANTGGDTGWLQCSAPGVSIISGVGVAGALICTATSAAFSGSVGAYNITSDTSVRDDPGNPLLDESYSANNTGGSPGNIIIEAMANTYSVNAPQFQLLANGNGNISATNTLAAYIGSTNAICPAGVNACTPPSAAPSTAIITDTFTSSGAYSYNISPIVNFSPTIPYSTGLSFQIASPTNAGDDSGDLFLDAVPEPTAVALFGSVILFMVGAIRRKTRRNS
jgi:hypothetical protein